MLPTFVIGLREGLEAALIVSIVATFLRRNDASLKGLWIGVGSGIGLSIAVGVVLRVVEQGLPQRQQEMLETVIGVVAICFVTVMIFWMRTHARTMKRELESAAADALKSGTTTALAVMGFLAVLREGFETSVFLLAAIQNAGNAPTALIGAILGLAVAAGLGWGIYAGGLRLNLQLFFKVTGIFLVFVAAGLVMYALRTANEAGWVTVGQGRTVDLSWFTPAGSIRSAVVSGILGIQPDPRVVEVLGWLAYLMPMLALMVWPPSRLPSAALARKLKLAGAAVAVVVAAGLFLFTPVPHADVPAKAPLADGHVAALSVDGDKASLSAAGKTVALTDPSTDNGVTTWHAHGAGDQPRTLDAAKLLTYTGGRVPVGLNMASAPGPYRATWSGDADTTVVTSANGIVDVKTTGTRLLTISGGGLAGPRTFTVDAAGWQLDPTYAAKTGKQVAAVAAEAHDRMLWKHWVPVVLVIIAAALLWRSRRKTPPSQEATPTRKSVVEGPVHVA